MRVSTIVLVSVAMMLSVIGATASPIAEASVEIPAPKFDYDAVDVQREVPREPGRGGYNREAREPGRGGYNREAREPGRGGYNREARDQEGEDITGRRGNQEGEDIIGRRENQEEGDITRNDYLGRILEYQMPFGGARNFNFSRVVPDYLHHVLSVRYEIVTSVICPDLRLLKRFSSEMAKIGDLTTSKWTQVRRKWRWSIPVTQSMWDALSLSCSFKITMRISTVVLVSVAMMLSVIGANASPIGDASVDNSRLVVGVEARKGCTVKTCTITPAVQ
ncbi:hypothetical protein BD769DRAFT_1381794 [Suillus cothurnatus]|nr:hypothetical protein BD769DRAFT_1381794 [Suillus cothurnatus]